MTASRRQIAQLRARLQETARQDGDAARDLTRIAVEDTQDWLRQAVVGLNLCPFAKSVVVKGMVRYAVCLSDDPQDLLAMLREELRHLAAADPVRLDTTLLIAPFALPDFLDFNDFLDEADALLEACDLAGVLQVADFHPQYQFAGEPPDAMSHFTNRAPYPTLHLLREASIDQAVEAYPDAVLIYQRNIARLEALGPQGWQALGLRARLAAGSDGLADDKQEPT